LINDPVVTDLAQKYNTSAQQILLSYALSQSVGIVPKSTSPERIHDNFQVLNLRLNEEDLNRLNSIDKDGHYIRCTGWLVK
jgi:diketogulonate reductase-like aldo/keto reductase